MPRTAVSGSEGAADADSVMGHTAAKQVRNVRDAKPPEAHRATIQHRVTSLDTELVFLKNDIHA